ncbi:MAG: sigma-70 family RNA polymerase sigma factor [Verrucomicrobia bacterium]|nr:sigma-70 family RNA polymerase sigma factor [Verrucomicrobiota bacterium]
MSDHDLLRRYAAEGSQPAFAEIVSRHLDLVYSAARRQVSSPHLAEEIAQSVFLDLARHASRLGADTPLVAWLHLVTRRTAIDTIRREARRVAREGAAAALMKADLSLKAASWSTVEPLLDEAVESLDTPDRTAILLRFFENRSLREVGAALGTSDDAAQKRVSRALEQLRTFFLRRGVTVTAAGLATDLSAQALQIAPASLGAAISAATAASTTAAAGAALETTRLVAMTTLQKSIAIAVFAAIGGAGIYQAAAYVREDSNLTQLQTQSTALLRELGSTRASHETLTRRLAEVETQIDARLAQARRAPLPADPKLEGTLATWLTRANRLQSLLSSRPELAIPELRLLSSEQWIEIASKSAAGVDTGSDPAIKDALALARKTAEQLFAPQLRRALKAYVEDSGGMLPDSLYQLLPHFDSPVAPALLSRYQLLQTGKLADLPRMDQVNWLIETREAVDVERDNIVSMGTDGWAMHSASSPSARVQWRKAIQKPKP